MDIYAKDKERLYMCVRAYLPMSIVTTTCSLFLEYQYTPFIHIMTGALFSWYWAYGIHRIHHSIPSTGIFYYLNPHISIHHSDTKVLPRWLDLTIECLQNMAWFVPLYILQEVSNIHIVPNSIIALSLLVYASVHYINYSLFESKKHIAQHLNPHINYGPDFLDHIFGTNSDDEFEDMSHFIPNCILSTLLIHYIRQWIG